MTTTQIPERPFAWFELQQLGLTSYAIRRLQADRTVRRLIQGVYAPTDLEDTVELRAAAIRLVLTEHMVLADRTAAWLHGVDHYRIDDLHGVPPLDVMAVAGSEPTRRKGTRGGKRALLEGDICRVSGVAVTTPARTAADLACLFGRREALAVLDAFMRICGVTRDELEQLVIRFAGRRGVTQLRELVALATPLAESPGESWSRIDVLDAGLPAPQPQFWIKVNGVEKYRLDLAYPLWKIAVEYDGEEFHTVARGPGRGRAATHVAASSRMDRDRRDQGGLPTLLQRRLVAGAPRCSRRADAHDSQAAVRPRRARGAAYALSQRPPIRTTTQEVTPRRAEHALRQARTHTSARNFTHFGGTGRRSRG